MLVPTEGMQSGEGFYRKIVVRNVVCTVCMVVVYVIKTLVIFFALVHESNENNEVRCITL